MCREGPEKDARAPWHEQFIWLNVVPSFDTERPLTESVEAFYGSPGMRPTFERANSIGGVNAEMNHLLSIVFHRSFRPVKVSSHADMV
jgi:hypothetical protein